MLTELQQHLWNAYQQAEASAPRAAKLAALAAFLDSLSQSPEHEWFPWARSLAERMVDEGEMVAIRQPLVERAIVPALLAGYRNGLPGCARWLASYAAVLRYRKDLQAQLPEDERTELGLLLAALRHDPNDFRAGRRLLEKRADRIQFALHELPAGVLYDINGATAEECLELQQELEDFCQLVAQFAEEEKFKDLIAAAHLHFRAYREYRLSPGACRSYAEFLDQRPDLHSERKIG